MAEPTISDAVDSSVTNSMAKEEDDYMSMAIIEPVRPLEKETYSQRRIRKQRESEARANPKSKAELATLEYARREDALSTTLPSDSKGFKMMAKLGFKPGNVLGAPTNKDARKEPIHITVKEDKGGVGMEGEKKRKFREEAERRQNGEKKAKAEEGDYRERMIREREEERVAGMFWGAMRVLESFEIPEAVEDVLLERVNVLCRALAREREKKERERRMRYDLHQSLGRDRKYDYPEEDEQDRHALRKKEDLEEEDEELDEFLALEEKEKLRRVVACLREKHFYCFWCKYKYNDEKMESCPGGEEDDHD